MPRTLLVRYGELALKSPAVRREFEHRLKGHILSALYHAGQEGTVTDDHGHLYVNSEVPEQLVPLVCRIFGVVSVSVATVLPTDLSELSRFVVDLAGAIPDGSRFAIRARRTGTHPFTSHDVDVRLGADVIAAHGSRGLKVDLTHPDREIAVEIRGPRTYVYMDRHPGPGGFPLGVAGRVGALVEGRRGALGAWLLMKRGCQTYTVSSPAGLPFTEILKKFDGEIDMTRVAEGRTAWEILRTLTEDRRLSGVVLSLTVDDFDVAREFWGDTVLFSPTVGMPEEEVERRWLEIEKLAR
jgi:thiamine biosynthesis protein ThiI